MVFDQFLYGEGRGSMCLCRTFIMADVKLYATPDSAETREAEYYLGQKGFCYETRDISTDEQARASMLQMTGQTSRPVIVVGDRVFVGFDEAALDDVLP